MGEKTEGHMKKTGMKRRTFGALTAGAVVAGSLPARAADKVLRFVQNGNMAGILNAYEVCEVCETTASVTRSIISCCRISFTRRGLKAFGRRGPLSSIA